MKTDKLTHNLLEKKNQKWFCPSTKMKNTMKPFPPKKQYIFYTELV